MLLRAPKLQWSPSGQFRATTIFILLRFITNRGGGGCGGCGGCGGGGDGKQNEMAGEDERRKRVESLGWLTESSVMPKKHRAIKGIGVSSIVELKAQLYRTQEQARKAKESATGSSSEFLHAKKQPSTPDLFS